ncbi:MAG: iron-sulfur cluster assembly accessory protein [Bacteroidetes bacterium]|jgi:iron-sulfur cluster assembly accessory protein|nr:MAG: iron-sulfur cluster assembly accessory protein [Bacteroidota bacterium]TAE68978.1 MAG: iron-sulfur cluster assembly accessory protein [Bacteroidota bacterium]TAF90738.1 MAG: iron-sulfur cluster assembly accessory protein [Bacteroidota bacterium]
METAIQTAPVSFTEGAITEIKRLMNEPSFDTTQVLRVGVKGGGCSGMTYVLGFDAKQENDAEYEVEGLPFIMNKSHELYLFGMNIDWQDGLNSRGFTFKNPNASSTCGCGTSFAV